jgi:ribonuclease BN (tRNA processing enzyme)
MIIGFIGGRGTVPTANFATVSFLVNNKYLFECPSEIVQAFHKFQQRWMNLSNLYTNSRLSALGKPTLGKISHIILSHLHFDHWGGLAHIIHRIMLLEKEKRSKIPLKIIIPKDSTLPFQQRMNQMFMSTNLSSFLPDDEFFYRLLAIEVGESVRSVLQIIVIDDGETISLDPDFSLSAKNNKHLALGSHSYKLEFKITKLNVEKAKKLGIPFNRILKKIERSQKSIEIGDHKVSRSDIFFDINTILCYSGDTHVDSELFEFFKDCQILIHESTYLTREDGYHLDSHSDIISLVKESDNLTDLKLLIPLHFSIRYTEEEISDSISVIPNKSYKILDLTQDLVVQIEPGGPVTILKKTD